MVLYVEKDGRSTIHFLTSPNLREWTPASVTEAGPNAGRFLFECPDLFPLALDPFDKLRAGGDAKNTKWILAAAITEYVVGTFDGQKFTAETPPLHGHRAGKPDAHSYTDWDYYAPQTISDAPNGRRLQIGWFQTKTPGMPFNQSMGIPTELGLITTPDGPRLTWTPVKELESLRAKLHVLDAFTLAPGAANPLAAITAELVEIRAELVPIETAELTFNIRGVPVIYDATKQEIIVNGRRAPAPLKDGRQSLIIYADRTGSKSSPAMASPSSRCR